MADKNVTRIKAKDESVKKAAVVDSKPNKTAKKVKPVKAKKVKKESKNPFVRAFRGMGEYFKGAWYELRQVRWPTRRATWELTLAVLIFSAFFMVFILLLDLLFQWLFEQIII